MSNPLLTAAIEYAAHGWPVFPCRPKTKVPFTPRGFLDATTDPEAIKFWWQRWPDANIGLCTGPISGLAAIDIDTEKGGDVSFAALEAQHGPAPATRTSRTGSGGRHLLYRMPAGGFKCTASKLGKGIDTRGEGGYIVAPPSIHPNGNTYRWEDEEAPTELPAWLHPATREPLPTTATPRQTRPDVYIDPSHKLARASAYLATMDAATQGLGGHNALYAAATVLVHGFDMSDAEAVDMLATEYNPRCLPPWDLTDWKDAKDFRRKITQARTQPHDQPRGWLLDAGQPDEADTATGAAIAAALMASHAERTRPGTHAQPDPARPSTPADPAPAAKTDSATSDTPAPAAKPARIPDHLLSPPGLVGQLVAWMNRTAFKRQPALALANALAFWGAVVGRKVADDRDLRTNLYTMGVAHSGSGKDHSRACVKKLCKAAGATDTILGGEEIASDSAILASLHRSPSLLFQLDEIGHMVAAGNAYNAATYTKAIPVTFTKLFSSAATLYLGKEYASAEVARQDIDQPNACLYGTTVPSTLYAGLSPSQIRDGFLGRVLVFIADDDDPEPTYPPLEQPPEALIAAVQAWAIRRIDAPAGTGNLAAAMTDFQLIATTEPAAEARFRRLQASTRDDRAELREGTAGLDALWSRAEENSRKVALVLASGCSYDAITITDAIAAYACDLITHLTGRLVDAVGQNVSENLTEANSKRMLALIRQAGGRGITKNTITRKTQWLDNRHRTPLLAGLLEAGLIAGIEESTGGRPATRYVTVEVLREH